MIMSKSGLKYLKQSTAVLIAYMWIKNIQKGQAENVREIKGKCHSAAVYYRETHFSNAIQVFSK